MPSPMSAKNTNAHRRRNLAANKQNGSGDATKSKNTNKTNLVDDSLPVAPKASFLQYAAVPKSVFTIITLLFCCVVSLNYFYRAYTIRLKAIELYGYLIHEFDPWFNYRATEYLYWNGAEKFNKWFDYESWYPIGRPVGSTIFPGMQFTAVWIKQAFEKLGLQHTLTEVCCLIPAWFGSLATLFTALISYECTKSYTVFAVTAFFMGIIPAHIMRSMGGGFDNECVAVAAMTLTFYLWIKSVEYKNSWPWAFAAAFAYWYMVASWGGYVFVLNMIGLHATFMIASNQYSTNLFYAYSIFYSLGTFLACQVPVVNTTPLKSLEQICPMILFFGMFGLQYCELERQKKNLGFFSLQVLRVKVMGLFAAVGFTVLYLLIQLGFMRGLSARVAGLFVKHTKTGNVLVDSVAEHQPASTQAYFHYLHLGYYAAPVGFLILILLYKYKIGNNQAKLFVWCYAVTSYYFSAKMVRLIIFLGPISSILSGVAFGTLIAWTFSQFVRPEADAKKIKNPAANHDLVELDACISNSTKGWYDYNVIPVLRKAFGLWCLFAIRPEVVNFINHCDQVAESHSNPTLVFMAQLNDGQVVKVTDYYDSLVWLRENTPRDARVMAWWDYGYQINGIGNRTSIADGNTWNHEHIATLARCLVSPQEKAHDMIRLLADYMYVWTGGGGDDLGKSMHIARIGNSVYKNMLCPDILCNTYGFMAQNQPTPLMEQSLVYKLVGNRMNPSVRPDPELFEQVYQSKYGKVKIYKVKNVDEESKKWVADPANRVCDEPGSWICRGQYPPKMQKYIKDMTLLS